MFDGLFQPMHLLIILGLALLFFGPKRLPELGKGLGTSIRDFKDALSGGHNKPEENRMPAQIQGAPTGQTYAPPPQQGYAPAPQGYAPVQQPYAAPVQQAYAPPVQQPYAAPADANAPQPAPAAPPPPAGSTGA